MRIWLARRLLHQNETLLNQADPSEMIPCEPIVELHCVADKAGSDSRKEVLNVDQYVDVDKVSLPMLRTQFDVTTQQRVDFNNPIIQAQIERERCIQSNEHSLNAGSCNSFGE